MTGFMEGPLGWQRVPTPSGGEGACIGEKKNQHKINAGIWRLSSPGRRMHVKKHCIKMKLATQFAVIKHVNSMRKTNKTKTHTLWMIISNCIFCSGCSALFTVEFRL
jgi:hypothetical protein